jgi:phosphomannomutase
MDIRFGTAGWRAVLAKDFTFENLNRVIQAVALWLRDEQITENGVVLGYDTRFMGQMFAEYAACVFAAMDIPVRLSTTGCPTPAVSWAALEHEAVGVMITGSHNPPEYNGVKVKAPYGGPVSPYQIEDVEAKIADASPGLKPAPLDTYLESGMIRQADLREPYLNVLRHRIDLEHILNSKILIAHDSMYGSGRGMLHKLLGSQVLELHHELNPGYEGIAPEPSRNNLKDLEAFVKEHDCEIGIATDGDAERVCLFDEKGNYVDANLILCLLTKYMAQKKGLKGCVIKSFSTTHMLNKQAEKYGLMIQTTPIGFKYITEKMISCDVIVGGEESGGMTVKGHIPEMDGIYIALLIVEMILKSGRQLSRLVQDLYDEFGPHYNRRVDVPLTDVPVQDFLEHVRNDGIRKIGDLLVTDWEFKDGTKMWLEDGTWVLVRASGTEPVLRVYCEASDPEKAGNIAETVAAMAKGHSNREKV